jgi:hypothetical protein
MRLRIRFDALTVCVSCAAIDASAGRGCSEAPDQSDLEHPILKHDLVNVQVERHQVVFSHGGFSWMSTLTAHVEATFESGVLVGVYHPYSFDYPQHDSVEDLPHFTQRIHSLRKVESLEPAFCQTWVRPTHLTKLPFSVLTQLSKVWVRSGQCAARPKRCPP